MFSLPPSLRRLDPALVVPGKLPKQRQRYIDAGLLDPNGPRFVPVVLRCAACRAATGCGRCPACRQRAEGAVYTAVCHHLPPCPACGAVQEVPLERLKRHRYHQQVYGDWPALRYVDVDGAQLRISIAQIGLLEPLLGLPVTEHDEAALQSGAEPVEPGDVLVLSGWLRRLALEELEYPTAQVRLIDPDYLAREIEVELAILSSNIRQRKSPEIQLREYDEFIGRLYRMFVSRQQIDEIMRSFGLSARTVRRYVQAIPEHVLPPAAGVPGWVERAGQPDGAAGGRTPVPTAIPVARALAAGEGVTDRHLIDRSLVEGGLKQAPPATPVEDNDLYRAGLMARAEGEGQRTQAYRHAFLFPEEELPGDEPEEEVAYEVLARAGLDGAEIRQALRLPTRVVALPPPGQPLRLGNLEVYAGGPDEPPFATLPAVDLVLAAPIRFLDFLYRGADDTITHPAVTEQERWNQATVRDELLRELRVWREATRPGGRLALLAPLRRGPGRHNPLSEALLLEAGWYVGAVLAISDEKQPSLYAHSLPARAPVCPSWAGAPLWLIYLAAPVLERLPGESEEACWMRSWQYVWPGQVPADRTLREAGLWFRLWQDFRGPGPRTRWAPDFHAGVTYHLTRMLCRPDGVVWLPELGGPAFTRGCLRTGRRVIATTRRAEQLAVVVERLTAVPERATVARSAFPGSRSGDGATGAG